MSVRETLARVSYWTCNGGKLATGTGENFATTGRLTSRFSNLLLAAAKRPQNQLVPAACASLRRRELAKPKLKQPARGRAEKVTLQSQIVTARLPDSPGRIAWAGLAIASRSAPPRAALALLTFLHFSRHPAVSRHSPG